MQYTCHFYICDYIHVTVIYKFVYDGYKIGVSKGEKGENWTDPYLKRKRLRCS